MGNKFFQWIAGDRKGEVLVFDRIESDEENVYIVFKDNSRINEVFVASLNQTDLTGKFMAEVDSPQNIWSFKEEWVGRQEEVWEQNADGESVCVIPFVEGRKIINLIPPRKSAPRSSNFGNMPVQAPVPTPVPKIIEIPDAIDKTDPVYILMSKSKKIENEINMIMTVSLPPKSLYDISKSSFDEGDKKFIDYIVDEMSIDQIKDALKSALRDMYDENPSNND